MALLMIFILWTWGLTPVWVNIVGTVLCSIAVLGTILKIKVSVED